MSIETHTKTTYNLRCACDRVLLQQPIAERAELFRKAEAEKWERSPEGDSWTCPYCQELRRLPAMQALLPGDWKLTQPKKGRPFWELALPGSPELQPSMTVVAGGDGGANIGLEHEDVQDERGDCVYMTLVEVTPGPRTPNEALAALLGKPAAVRLIAEWRA